MKIIPILLISLLFIQFISAVEVDMKTEFDQGETLLAKVAGNFLKPILKDNIEFKRGHISIPMEYDVAKIDDEYYIYAQLPQTQANYSMTIKDTLYMKGVEQKDDEIISEFTISNKTADFKINKGFVTTNKDFFIEVQNIQDSPLDINLEMQTTFGTEEGFFASLFNPPSKKTQNPITLKSGEKKKIYFSVQGINQASLKTISISSENLNCELPVYVYVSEESQAKKRKLEFITEDFKISTGVDFNKTKIISLKNSGEQTMKNIVMSTSDSLKPFVSFSITKIKELDVGEEIKIETYIFSTYEAVIEGEIKAKTEQGGLFVAYLPTEIDFSKTYVPSDDEEQETEVTEDQETSTGKIIGWTLVIIVIAFLAWFFLKKYRGTEREKPDLLKVAKGKK